MYRLLIADDEVIERESIKYIVKQNLDGVFEVCEAANGRELVEKAEAFKPDVVLVDIKMPGINGLEASSRIREILPECRIIIMSAFNYFTYAKEALSLKVDDYIIKPAPEMVVVNTLNEAIAHISEERGKKRKEEETNSKLKNIMQYLEEELIFLLSSGEIEAAAVKEFFEMLGIDSKAFICTAISLSDGSLPREISGEVQKQIIKKRIIEKTRNKLRSRGVQLLQGTAGQQVFLLLFVDDELDEYESRVFWAKLFYEIRDEIMQEMQINLNIGIGNRCTSAEQLCSSFLQAKIALKYDPVQGSVISYGDIYIESGNTEYPVNKEKQLFESFLQGDKKCSLQLVDELIDWISVRFKLIREVRQEVYELLLVLVRQAAMNLSVMNADTEGMRRDLFLLDSVRDIKILAKKFIEDKITEMQSAKSIRANSLLSLAKDFIGKYFDSDISLESAADEVKVSPFYLSRLFKKETGVNFIDYLTEFRINKAKELLSVPTNNIKDVCYLVGYKDPNYFARVFKKMCGYTPTEFREKNKID